MVTICTTECVHSHDGDQLKYRNHFNGIVGPYNFCNRGIMDGIAELGNKNEIIIFIVQFCDSVNYRALVLVLRLFKTMP